MRSPNHTDWVNRWPTIVALVWAGSTFIAWCLSWRVPPVGLSDEAGLTVLGLCSLFVAVTVRFPRIFVPQIFAFTPPSNACDGDWTRSSAATPELRELVWLGAWAGQVNMLGITALIAPSLASVLPAILVMLVVEAFLIRLAPTEWQPTVSTFFASLPALSTGSATPGRLQRTGVVQQRELSARKSLLDTAVIGAESESENESWMRSSVQGRTENGGTYLQGWVQFELEAGQKTCALTVVFSPAFMMIPEVELDQEVEPSSDTEPGSEIDSHTCHSRLEHVTPSGMRVAIKRSHAESTCRGRLLWHASPAEQHADAGHTALRDRLP